MTAPNGIVHFGAPYSTLVTALRGPIIGGAHYREHSTDRDND